MQHQQPELPATVRRFSHEFVKDPSDLFYDRLPFTIEAAERSPNVWGIYGHPGWVVNVRDRTGYPSFIALEQRSQGPADAILKSEVE